MGQNDASWVCKNDVCDIRLRDYQIVNISDPRVFSVTSAKYSLTNSKHV